MKSIFNQWKKELFEPVDVSSLGLFRFLFGFLLIIQSFLIFNEEFIQINFINNYFHFPHPLFEWLRLGRLPAAETHLLFLVMGISAVGICSGILFKLSSFLYLVTFSYVFLYEKALYNAHYYLIILICGWFCLINANRWPELPTFRKKNTWSPYIPGWQIWILKFQFLVVYFYGGLSKFNTDWLIYAEPVHRILSNQTVFGISLDNLFIAYLVSYTGLIIDIGMPFFLLNKRTRPLGFTLAILFNLANIWMFKGDIGIFPFLMIVALVLFIRPETPRAMSEKFFKEKKPNNFSKEQSYNNPPDRRNLILTGIIIYIVFQLIFPLRHWLYPGDVRWTYEGARFSWHLKVNAKDVRLKIYAIDPFTDQKININHLLYLTINQQWLDNIPDMLYQFTQFMKQELINSGIKNPQIFIECSASLNRRPFQLYLDPKTDFSMADYSVFRHSPWILPFDNTVKPQRP
jgi:hypothetical protein